jgi:hypothetical protein
MYTHSLAEELRKVTNDARLKRKLKKVEDLSLEASSAGARAALAMFEALDTALESDDPKTVETARRIYAGPFNQIVA